MDGSGPVDQVCADDVLRAERDTLDPLAVTVAAHSLGLLLLIGAVLWPAAVGVTGSVGGGMFLVSVVAVAGGTAWAWRARKAQDTPAARDERARAIARRRVVREAHRLGVSCHALDTELAETRETLGHTVAWQFLEQARVRERLAESRDTARRRVAQQALDARAAARTAAHERRVERAMAEIRAEAGQRQPDQCARGGNKPFEASHG